MTMSNDKVFDAVLNRITDGVKSGHKPEEIADQALREIISLGLSTEMLKELGPSVIVQYWTRESIRLYGSLPTSAPDLGERRIDLSQLAGGTARLEAIVEVAGNFVRVGDLQKHECYLLQQRCIREAAMFLKRGKFFEALANGLPEGKKVQDVHTDESLTKLWEKS